MITIGNVELRNLEEQVLANKEAIAKHFQATNLPLNLAGIEVIGKIDNASELEDKVGTRYGDTYVQVVDDVNTVLWIWSRANPDAGELQPYWLDIPFTSVGPAGPEGAQGPQGEKGQRGSQWFVGNLPPTDTTGYNVGDMFLNSKTGNIWHLHEAGWVQEGNITGPQGIPGLTGPQGPQGEQGIQGIQGPQGETGSIFEYIGYVDSASQLPDPVELDNLAVGYLVGAQTPYHIYAQVGSDSSVATWKDLGPINGATQVISSDTETYYTEWDADTKLDKYVPTNNTEYLYGVGAGGGTNMYPISTLSTALTVPVRTQNGDLTVPLTPSGNDKAASKKYVDDLGKRKLTLPTASAQLDTVPVVLQNTINAVKYLAVSNGVSNDVIVKRTTNGNINLPAPNLQNGADYAASVGKVGELITSRLNITSTTVPKNETWPDLLHKADYGIHLIKGPSTIRYWASDNYRQITGNLHLIIIAPESNFTRIVHFYTSGILTGYQELDAVLETDLEIQNNSKAAGCRVIKDIIK